VRVRTDIEFLDPGEIDPGDLGLPEDTDLSNAIVISANVWDQNADPTDEGYTDIIIDAGDLGVETCWVYKQGVGPLDEVDFSEWSQLPTTKPPGVPVFARNEANNYVIARLYVGDPLLGVIRDNFPPITQLTKLLPYFEQNYDIVIGSRGSVRKNAPLLRKIAAKVFLNFRRLFILPEIADTQCGFKAFRREAIRDIFSKMTIFKDIKKVRGWRVTAYDVEVLFLGKRLGYSIKEIPVEWQDKDISVTKQHNFVKESKEMAWEILRVKLNDLKGRYGK